MVFFKLGKFTENSSCSNFVQPWQWIPAVAKGSWFVVNIEQTTTIMVDTIGPHLLSTRWLTHDMTKIHYWFAYQLKQMKHSSIHIAGFNNLLVDETSTVYITIISSPWSPWWNTWRNLSSPAPHRCHSPPSLGIPDCALRAESNFLLRHQVGAAAPDDLKKVGRGKDRSHRGHPQLLMSMVAMNKWWRPWWTTPVN